jgi:hypothetical protein
MPRSQFHRIPIARHATSAISQTRKFGEAVYCLSQNQVPCTARQRSDSRNTAQSHRVRFAVGGERRDSEHEKERHDQRLYQKPLRLDRRISEERCAACADVLQGAISPRGLRSPAKPEKRRTQWRPYRHSGQAQPRPIPCRITRPQRRFPPNAGAPLVFDHRAGAHRRRKRSTSARRRKKPLVEKSASAFLRSKSQPRERRREPPSRAPALVCGVA